MPDLDLVYVPLEWDRVLQRIAAETNLRDFYHIPRINASKYVF